jgi:hypothetical protein
LQRSPSTAGTLRLHRRVGSFRRRSDDDGA